MPPVSSLTMSRHCNVTSFVMLHNLHCRDITSFVSSATLLVTTPTALGECAHQHSCVVDGSHVECISHTHTHQSTFTYTHREYGCVWVHVTHKAGVQGTSVVTCQSSTVVLSITINGILHFTVSSGRLHTCVCHLIDSDVTL